jgi:hypothetical protein
MPASLPAVVGPVSLWQASRGPDAKLLQHHSLLVVLPLLLAVVAPPSLLLLLPPVLLLAVVVVVVLALRVAPLLQQAAGLLLVMVEQLLLPRLVLLQLRAGPALPSSACRSSSPLQQQPAAAWPPRPRRQQQEQPLMLQVRMQGQLWPSRPCWALNSSDSSSTSLSRGPHCQDSSNCSSNRSSSSRRMYLCLSGVPGRPPTQEQGCCLGATALNLLLLPLLPACRALPVLHSSKQPLLASAVQLWLLLVVMMAPAVLVVVGLAGLLLLPT